MTTTSRKKTAYDHGFEEFLLWSYVRCNKSTEKDLQLKPIRLSLSSTLVSRMRKHSFSDIIIFMIRQ